MTFGDFSSLVQLGVGLHAGTALFQLLTEFGVAPIERRINRISDFALTSLPTKQKAIRNEANALKTDLSIFKTRAFSEYKTLVKINFAVAFLLLIALVVISFLYNNSLPIWLGAALAFFSTVPAVATVVYHTHKASASLAMLNDKVKACEKKIISLNKK